jgi:hypothetical protein
VKSAGSIRADDLAFHRRKVRARGAIPVLGQDQLLHDSGIESNFGLYLISRSRRAKHYSQEDLFDFILVRPAVRSTVATNGPEGDPVAARSCAALALAAALCARDIELRIAVGRLNEKESQASSATEKQPSGRPRNIAHPGRRVERRALTNSQNQFCRARQ